MNNFHETMVENPEPYNSIFNFIKDCINPKYPCLTSVYQDNFDEEGNPVIEYYIRYSANLSQVNRMICF